MPDTLSHYTHKEFLKKLLVGDRSRCSEIVNNLLNSNVSVQELYENVLKKSLYDIGELWERNEISVATEHLGTAIVEAILNEVYSRFILKEKINNTVVVSCVESEFHQVGIKMIRDVFEMQGWNALYLGANTPTNELISFLKKVKPDVLAISLSLYFNLPILENTIQLIRKELPMLPILVGGQAFLKGGQEVLLKYENVTYKSDIKNTELYIKNINKNG